MIFILLIVGVTSLSFAYPGVLEPVAEMLLGEFNSQNISNNSLNSSTENVSSNNDTKKRTSILKGYSKIEVNGLNVYIKNEQNDSMVITNKTEYKYIQNTSDTENNELIEFVGINIAQLSAENGSFFILVSNISNNSDISSTLKNYDNLNVENNDELTDEIIENTTDNGSRINSDIKMSFLGNDIRVVHYNKFTMENSTSEMIWAYFKVNNTDVSIGWAGNTIDMNIIESFFKLN